MATKEEYQAWGLTNDLWYRECDFLRFRQEHRNSLMCGYENKEDEETIDENKEDEETIMGQMDFVS